MDQPLSLGSLMAFYFLLAGVSDPARKMSEVMGVLQRGIAAADRIYEILDYEPKIVDPPQPKQIANPRPELVFDRVSFQYSTGQQVLHEVDLRIPFGQTVADRRPQRLRQDDARQPAAAVLRSDWRGRCGWTASTFAICG